jgi:SAM-dependent methyltransferase
MFAQESVVMRGLRWLGMDSLAWSLRRYHCPVPKNALVLEVGSGGNPYVRANVLLDAYEDTRERHWAPLVSDRPTVLGFVENLPFRDGAFDFVIASHVFEHSAHPEKFLNELQRVARAGYIEVPDAFMERINPYRDHRLEITVRDSCLIVRKKVSSQVDPDLIELYEARAKRPITQMLMPTRPFDFHVRYYWSEQIDFKVLNPEVNANWQAAVDTKYPPTAGKHASLRTWLRKFIRLVASQGRRNRDINLLHLLRCPVCCATDLKPLPESLTCSTCNTNFLMTNGIPSMFAPYKNNSTEV